MDRKRLIALGVTGVVIVGAGAYIARATLFPPKDKADQLLAEMKGTPEEQRGESMRRFREQADQMTEEERQKLREGMRTMLDAQIGERITEYENAPDDQKVAVLDKHIDDFVARRADWEKRRAEWEADRARSGERAPGSGQPGDGGQSGAGGQPGAGQGGGGAGGTGGREGDTARGGPEGRGPGGPRQPPTIEERKRRMEGTNPDGEVRRMRYMRAVRERAQKRGIEMGPGPGGRGGPGGGRGPGPGGRGGM